MNQLARDRQAKWQYQILKEFPKLTTIKERVTLGTFSWNLMSSKVRLLDAKNTIDIGFGAQTPPEIARDYIAVCFPKRLRAYSDQIRAFTNPSRHAVLFCNPSRLVKGSYVDISAAYWNITRIVGFNLEYFPPQKWLGQGRHVEDFPLPHHKVARSSIVSQGLIRPLLMWDGAKMIEGKKVGGRSVNQALWALVQDVLHSIAAELLVKCDLRYAHTDGFIVPAHHSQQAQDIISEYGLTSKIKTDEKGNRATGLTYVLGVGRYIVGDVRTQNTEAVHEGQFSNIEVNSNPRFLKARMSHFSGVRASMTLDDILA